jgi:predicted permease
MFLYIAVNVILPIFIVMGIGFLISKFFSLDLGSLSKLNFYVFIPVFMFYSLLIFKPATQEMVETIIFNLLLACLTFGVMYGITKLMKLDANLAAASTLSVMIFNSANYGIPVVQLAFQGEGAAIQVITITAMNVLTYTLGILVIGGWSEWKKGVREIVRLPIIYALILAIVIRSFNIDMPDAIMTPLKWIADGMASIALLTLGAQMGKSGITMRRPWVVILTVAARLILCPLLAFGLIHLMGLHGLLARVLFVSSAFPTAVVTVIFGIEYDKEPTFMADVAFITTLLSAITVTGAISLSAGLF